MNLNFSLHNFRCFAEAGPVRIAPITLLIGENSSGKTSFMAAIKQAVEAFGRGAGTPFNSEPYYLGSFEQIAHFRGGRSGRAKRFTLEIQEAGPAEQSDLFQSSRRISRDVNHRITYSKGDTQPEISEYSVRARGTTANLDLSTARAKLSLTPDGMPAINISTDRGPPSQLIRRDVSYLWYYLQEAVRREASDEGAPLSEENQAAIKTLTTAVRQSSRSLDRNVFASAPVRIQPRRVYTPSELSSLNSGEQVPLQIANMKISSPEKWEAAKARMNLFGSRAGLFEDIEIKRFGKTTSDPFQLQIKNFGPASNIVDVGYGVSQALPLLFPLEAEIDYDFFLLQQPEVHLHPRAQAEFGSVITRLSSRYPNNNYLVETHSDYIVDRVRSDVREGLVPSANVTVLLFRRMGLDTQILQLGIDQNGEITNFPDDYRKFFLEEQARVLGI